MKKLINKFVEIIKSLKENDHEGIALGFIWSLVLVGASLCMSFLLLFVDSSLAFGVLMVGLGFAILCFFLGLGVSICDKYL